MPKPTDKRVIEIADDIFKNLEMKRGDVVTKYAKRFQISERRVDTLYAEAKEYNVQRIQKAESVKDRVFISAEVESLEEAQNRRKRAIKILQDLADGIPQEIQTGRDPDTGEAIMKIIPVMPNDRIRAIAQLANMEQWNAPVKTQSELTINGVEKPIDALSDEELLKFIKQPQ